MIEIRLSSQEIVIGAMVGVLQQVGAMHKGMTHRYEYHRSDAWEQSINGACAEMALARYFDCYYRPIYGRGQRHDEGDVGDVQVRSTPRADGCLIVHEDDPDDPPFYLVVTAPPVFRIIGWLRGADAKRSAYWRDDVRFPAYFVPQSALEPPQSSLFAILNGPTEQGRLNV